MPVKTKMYNVRVTEDERNEFNEYCRNNNINPSEAIRSIMRGVSEGRLDLLAIVGNPSPSVRTAGPADALSDKSSIAVSNQKTAEGVKSFIEIFFPIGTPITPPILKAMPIFHILIDDAQKELKKLADANARAK